MRRIADGNRRRRLQRIKVVETPPADAAEIAEKLSIIFPARSLNKSICG
jgi:hypothetical protein